MGDRGVAHQVLRVDEGALATAPAQLPHDTAMLARNETWTSIPAAGPEVLDATALACGGRFGARRRTSCARRAYERPAAVVRTAGGQRAGPTLS